MAKFPLVLVEISISLLSLKGLVRKKTHLFECCVRLGLGASICMEPILLSRLASSLAFT